ncbi:helix-turn-helix domain-containing protein [Candidatus Parcubacteria bacterium]|nr:helix-turn-helix domain-containing protein [Candidatus Parcubacteria bacterium]
MNSFKINKISLNSETLGQLLKKEREAQKISLEKIANDLKINKKYLSALESERLQDLPAGVYARNYFKTYAEYLNLNADEILKQYEEEHKSGLIENKKNLFVQKVTKARYFFSIPKVFKITAILFAVFICVIYIGFYLNNLISPPDLVIFSPKTDVSVNQNKIEIKGQTEINANIKINGKDILAGIDGSFSTVIFLKNGLNVVLIEAQKKHSKKSEVIRNILVDLEK